MSEPEVMSFAMFAARHNLTTTADVDSHIHAGLRSKPLTKTYDRWNKRTLANLQTARRLAQVFYQAEIAAGRIRDFTSQERTELNATGHPDNLSTQAALRVLAKRRARANSAGDQQGASLTDGSEQVASAQRSDVPSVSDA